MMRNNFLKFIDLFYPIVSKWFSLHTYRYIAIGGLNAGLSIVNYYLIYNFLLNQKDWIIGSSVIKLITGPTLALIINSFLTLLIGFFLNKYIVFTQSNLKGRIQLFRYGTIFLINMFLNFAFLKILHESLHFYPSIAYAITTLALGVFSYFSQKYFSFKVKKHIK